MSKAILQWREARVSRNDGTVQVMVCPSLIAHTGVSREGRKMFGGDRRRAALVSDIWQMAAHGSGIAKDMTAHRAALALSRAHQSQVVCDDLNIRSRERREICRLAERTVICGVSLRRSSGLVAAVMLDCGWSSSILSLVMPGISGQLAFCHFIAVEFGILSSWHQILPYFALSAAGQRGVICT